MPALSIALWVTTSAAARPATTPREPRSPRRCGPADARYPQGTGPLPGARVITTSIDTYLAEGCGRCDDFQTPRCKVHTWAAELAALRAILLATELTEEMKWGSPCYTLDGGNVAMLGALRDCCSVSFFKGSLLADPEGALEAPGPNSQAARLLRFRSLAEVEARRELLGRYLAEAIALERAGAKVVFERAPEPLPDELLERLDGDAALAEAWDALTPGRRRSYVLHIGGAKQAATRAARVERCAPMILAGRGFHER